MTTSCACHNDAILEQIVCRCLLGIPRLRLGTKWVNLAVCGHQNNDQRVVSGQLTDCSGYEKSLWLRSKWPTSSNLAIQSLGSSVSPLYAKLTWPDILHSTGAQDQVPIFSYEAQWATSTKAVYIYEWWNIKSSRFRVHLRFITMATSLSRNRHETYASWQLRRLRSQLVASLTLPPLALQSWSQVSFINVKQMCLIPAALRVSSRQKMCLVFRAWKHLGTFGGCGSLRFAN